MALRLQEGHQSRLLPGIGVHMGVEALRQHAGNILQQAAAGDVGEGMNAGGRAILRPGKGQQALYIDAGRLDQMVDQQALIVEQGGAIKLPALVGGKAAHQRITVGMHA